MYQPSGDRSMARIASCSIKSLIVVETGTYNQIFARPYATILAL